MEMIEVNLYLVNFRQKIGKTYNSYEHYALIKANTIQKALEIAQSYAQKQKPETFVFSIKENHEKLIEHV